MSRNGKEAPVIGNMAQDTTQAARHGCWRCAGHREAFLMGNALERPVLEWSEFDDARKEPTE